ncbi:MAG TPA: response regulator [Candidatus Acidoferrales bacterium]|nr:response regulator [Candidatus Acidoferrales bacterium]
MKTNGFKSRLGLVIKKWRSRTGITRKALAKRAGLELHCVSDVERGEQNVSLESISKLSIALESSLATPFSSAAGKDAAGKPRQMFLSLDLVDILLVEDNPNDVELTICALQKVLLTNRVHVVRDGAEALDFIFRKGGYSRRQPDRLPQLILLDLRLPKISGWEVLRQVKAHPQTRAIPVVVLTASSSSDDIATSKRLGADGYIVKPVDLSSLSSVTPQLNLRWALVESPSAIRA